MQASFKAYIAMLQCVLKVSCNEKCLNQKLHGSLMPCRTDRSSYLQIHTTYLQQHLPYVLPNLVGY